MCDYKSFDIPVEVYEVAKEDISFATKMSLLEKNAIVEKTSNPNIVEEEDVVLLTVKVNDSNPYSIQIVVGDAEINERIDNALLNKRKDDSFSLTIENDNYQITIHGIKQYAETVTDEIAKKYFKMDCANDVTNYIKNDIEEHRKFEYAYELLLNKSMVKIKYENKTAYTTKILEYCNLQASQQGISTDEYVRDNYGYTIDEYRDVLNSFYDEYNILNHLIKNEKIEVLQKEFDRYLDSLADSYGMSSEELLLQNGKEFVYYNIYYDLSYSILLQYI